MTLFEAFEDYLHDVQTLVNNSFSSAGFCWILVTLLIYTGSLWLARKSGDNACFNPVLMTAIGVGLALTMTHSHPAQYQQSAGLIHFMLGPATVALAIPMYAQWQTIRESGWRLIAAVMTGGVVAPTLAWSSLFVVNAPLALQMTMLVKSITTPLALETSRQIGGIPALAAVFVIATGIVGAVTAPTVYRLLNVTMPQAKGVALGSVCHAIGTAKALKMSQRTGALATLGLCLNGIMTAIVLPLLFS